MKFNTMTLLGAIIISVGIVTCDFNSHTEPEINIDNAEILGHEIYINESPEKPKGIDSLYINEGDTLKLDLTTGLLNTPNYIWNVENDNVLKIIQIPGEPLSFYAVALMDSGITTTLLLDDDANDAYKKLNVVVTKYWADPDYYKPIGEFGGHHYYLSLRSKTWPEAKYNCEVAAGYLACINSQEENIFLNEVQKSEGTENIWIGIRYALYGSAYGLLYWVNGEEVTYDHFIDHNGPGKYAGRFYFAMATTANGIWINYPIAERFNYFLEIE